MANVQAQQLMGAASRAQQAGDIPLAQKLYAQVLSAEPNHAEALHQLGMLAVQAGRPDVGLELVERSLAVKPADAGLHVTRGLALAALGRLDDAIASYHKSLSLEPNSIGGLINLGNALLGKQSVDEAIGVYEKAVALRPDIAHTYVNLGCALRDAKRFEEAKSNFERAISLQRQFPEAEYLLGAALADLERFDEAILAYERALRLRAVFFEPLMGLGNALFKLDRFEESNRAYERAAAARPGDFAAHNDRAGALIEMGRVDEGIEEYRRAIGIKPEAADSHLHLGMGLLARGDFEEGWQEYEWRPQATRKRAGLSAARWDGGKMAGKTLLIVEEQGLGDAIQFVRYVPMAARASGATIVLECAPELVRLFGGVEGFGRIIPRGTELPVCDAYCPLLSLPYVMKTRRDSIPAQVPYLTADAAMIEKHRLRLEEARGLKVGLVWAGSTTHRQDRKRSLQLDALSALGTVPGTRLISLQKGRIAESKPGDVALIDWTEELRDLADTAALIANLDLVISVDTSVAHLAGAMAKPVWILLQAVPDWRWMLEGDSSPWYPTTRLFRQERIGSWAEPIRQMMEELTRAACQA